MSAKATAAAKAASKNTTVEAAIMAGGSDRGRTRGRGTDGRTSDSRAAMRRAREQRRASNPFLYAEGQNDVLPYVPDDDQWHYCWIRGVIEGKTDGANLVNQQQAGLRYEIVKPDELPEGCDLSRVTAREGEFKGYIQVRDCVLMRCDLEKYQLYLEAADLKADDMDRMVSAGDQAKQIPGEERTGIIVEENKERQGVRNIDDE